MAAPIADAITVSKKAPSGKKAPVKKTKVAKKSIEAKKTKQVVRLRIEELVAVPAGYQLPELTMEMVAGVEEQIRRLQAEAKFMRDLIAIRKRYGQ